MTVTVTPNAVNTARTAYSFNVLQTSRDIEVKVVRKLWGFIPYKWRKETERFIPNYNYIKNVDKKVWKGITFSL